LEAKKYKFQRERANIHQLEIIDINSSSVNLLCFMEIMGIHIKLWPTSGELDALGAMSFSVNHPENCP